MKRFGFAPRLVAVLGVTLGLTACKDEGIDTGAYVDGLPAAVCDAVIECNCEYPGGALYEHCIAQLGVGASTLAELNRVEGLSFDGVCAQKEIDAVGSLGCLPVVPDPDADCKTPCKVWYGPMSTGGTCTSINGYDNCKQGLACSEGVCVKPCAEADLPNVGEPCAPQYGCAEGAWCDAETAPLYPECAALPGAGQPCVDSDFGLLCAEDLVCDTSGSEPTCAALPGIGDECPLGACADGLFCDTTEEPFICSAPPTLGEPCPVGLCEPPYFCDGAGMCAQPPAPVCGYYGGVPEEGGSASNGQESGLDSGPPDTGLDTGGLDTGGLDTGDAGDCCMPRETPACSNADVAACVCAQDEGCCLDVWDDICVSEVVSFECGVC